MRARHQFLASRAKHSRVLFSRSRQFPWPELCVCCYLVGGWLSRLLMLRERLQISQRGLGLWFVWTRRDPCGPCLQTSGPLFFLVCDISCAEENKRPRAIRHSPFHKMRGIGYSTTLMHFLRILLLLAVTLMCTACGLFQKKSSAKIYPGNGPTMRMSSEESPGGPIGGW